VYYRIYEELPKPIDRTKIKKDHELNFWMNFWQNSGRNFENAKYKKIMLAMADQQDDSFLKGKIVADFGCGPRGTLAWAKSARLRIGIDVLSDKYADSFKESIIKHDMIYVKSTEKVIPIPGDFVDVVFTLNAMDHVDNFRLMCQEINRILKPGGEFMGSFNLEEPATLCEPQCLNEELINQELLKHMQTLSYRIALHGPERDNYKNFFENNLNHEGGQRALLWVRARKY
jgi:SAM-dependent methyltransferase